MVSGGFGWFHLALAGFRWFKVVSGGSGWLRMVSDGFGMNMNAVRSIAAAAWVVGEQFNNLQQYDVVFSVIR